MLSVCADHESSTTAESVDCMGSEDRKNGECVGYTNASKNAVMKPLKDHPVEAIAGAAGLLVLVAGVVLGREPGWQGTVGSGLAVLGSGLSAITAAWTFGRSSAVRTHNQQLSIVRRQIGTASAQIAQAVGQAEGGADPKLCLAIIDRATQGLSGAMLEMGHLTGEELGGVALVESMQEVAELGDQLAGLRATLSTQESEIEGETVSDLVAQLDSMQSSVDRALASLETAELASPQERRLVTENHRCPECGQMTAIKIGSVAGDSAAPVCLSCSSRFHAHRDGQGQLFVRVWGVMPRELTVLCPECDNQLRVRTATSARFSERYCFSCYALIRVDMDAESASVKTPSTVPIMGRADGSQRVVCSRCGDTHSSLARINGVLHAICHTCRGVVVATAPDATPRSMEEAIERAIEDAD